MRVADFFCGGGGFSEGFRQAGFEIVFAVDKWGPAIETYKGNKPNVNAILDDVVRLSLLDDDEFEKMVPDSEVIIGSPPCQAFSHSNKSGNADKSLGIKLIEAYLRIIARKKSKFNSVLKFWVLENVPAVEQFIKEEYTAKDLGLPGDVVLYTKRGASGIYNAKYFGAPTNRRRYLCGDFPPLVETHNDENVITLGEVLSSLGEPLSNSSTPIRDVNYSGFSMPRELVTDHHYIYELAPFEWNIAKRLKQDKGYMGKMAFPENLNKPARTVMATMSSSSREAMIIGMKDGRYRLPTVREVASMMSFPIDYQFFGHSKGVKHTLVGNAVPPKLSYAVAKAILLASGESIPNHYIPIKHNKELAFKNLNGEKYPLKAERKRRDVAKFKYHIPYLILSEFRVELTNYHSNFSEKKFRWDVEIHYSQGRKKAKFYTPKIDSINFSERVHLAIEDFCNHVSFVSFNDFQKAFCMTSVERQQNNIIGPYELLDLVRKFIGEHLNEIDRSVNIRIDELPYKLPQAILIGYYILHQILHKMEGL